MIDEKNPQNRIEQGKKLFLEHHNLVYKYTETDYRSIQNFTVTYREKLNETNPYSEKKLAQTPQEFFQTLDEALEKVFTKEEASDFLRLAANHDNDEERAQLGFMVHKLHEFLVNELGYNSYDLIT